MDVNKDSSDAWFAKLDQRLTMQDSTLARIEEQAMKTNGRVSSLEKWRYGIAGGMAVLVTLAGWGLVIWLRK